ncbi:MAG: methyl-accepting chemotaxis protein [Acidobacteriaceae bacterium]|jgi:methyl-accepting chemotaxis protein/methyl-accepting chemotaxis protein-1 (serine sensor receptor)
MASKLTIGRKLGVSVGILLVLIVSLGATAWLTLGGVGAELNDAVTRTATMMDLVQGIGKRSQETVSDIRGAALSYANGDQKTAAANEKKLQAAYTRMGEMEHDVNPLLTPAGRTGMDVVLRDLAAIRPLQEQYLVLSRDQKPADADALMRDKMTPLIAAMETDSLAVVKVNRAELADSVQRAAAVEASSHWTVAAVLTFALLVGGVVVIRVREIQRALSTAVDQLSSGAEQIANAASQVASSSNEVAHGASEQAASIEETSASTEEIQSMSRKNADNSRSMAELAEESQRMFVQTNRQLEEMVVSMEEIHQSSGKISKIIKVIDEIAFQTNILALNAAVEAARAGDAGMGFAVVANEVRNLAQRSAQAAEDTTRLIEDSIARSNAGKGKVDQVAQAIRGIAGGAARIKAMADDVNGGSAEQSRGLEQIVRSISRMEQVTQATAASAGESATIAETMNQQSSALRGVIGQLNGMVTQ